MGNIDSKLSNNPTKLNIKKDNDLIYAKMTRSQYHEFVKYLEYKNKIKKKRELENNKSINNKTEIITNKNEDIQKKKILSSKKKLNSDITNKKVYNNKNNKTNSNKLVSILNNKPNKINNLSYLKDIQVVSSFNKSPKRIQSILQNKPTKSNFNDNYESIFQQRQSDMNNTYFSNLKENGELEKHKNEFTNKQNHMDFLKINETNKYTILKEEKNIKSSKDNYYKKNIFDIKKPLHNSNIENENEKNKIFNEFKLNLIQFKENIDPYKLLNLDKNSCKKDVIKRYRELAIICHPDKGGDSNAFQALTKGFLSIIENIKKTKDNKNFYELKKESLNNNEYEKYDHCPLGDNENFNINLFNEIYNKTKLKSNLDIGYEGWMKDNKPKNNVNNTLFDDKFNINVFNTVFNQQREVNKDNNLQLYNEPEAKCLSKSNINYMEIDIDKNINDINFTNQLNKIGYTDYKEAMTNNLLVNNSMYNLKIKEKNLKNLKKEREKINYIMDNKDKINYELQKEKKELEEKERQKRIENRNLKISKNYKKINNTYISGNKLFQIKNE